VPMLRLLIIGVAEVQDFVLAKSSSWRLRNCCIALETSCLVLSDSSDSIVSQDHQVGT
jgi:hypothetical protein